MNKVIPALLRYFTVIAPLLLVLILWQLAAMGSETTAFFFSSPLGIAKRFATDIGSGALLVDFAYTFAPALIGFLVGVVGGTLAGFLILSFGRARHIAETYTLILGSIPIFAIAPMAEIWFGIGPGMKVALAILSTFFVSAANAYAGGRTVSPELIALYKSNGAGPRVILRKLIFPSALDWVFSSLRMSANLAVLGVFVGEYVASDRGLGRQMLNEGALYQASGVLAAALAMMLLIFLIYECVGIVETSRRALIRRLSISRKIWIKQASTTTKEIHRGSSGGF